jgi:hypothetical protein
MQGEEWCKDEERKVCKLNGSNKKKQIHRTKVFKQDEKKKKADLPDTVQGFRNKGGVWLLGFCENVASLTQCLFQIAHLFSIPPVPKIRLQDSPVFQEETNSTQDASWIYRRAVSEIDGLDPKSKKSQRLAYPDARDSVPVKNFPSPRASRRAGGNGPTGDRASSVWFKRPGRSVDRYTPWTGTFSDVWY